MDLLFKFVFLGLAVWVFWLVLRPGCAFVVRFSGGGARAVKGVATRAFLERVREICSQYSVPRATVRGVIHGQRISLAFSRGIPPSGRQQLRNWWSLSGWSALPTGSCGPPRRA